MRLHHLELTAFGPFAGTERVDFDALNDAGLFLLSGATGAGKTSILDAVCFALYGTVPGVRGVKALKSQHAEDHVAPEVVLEFSVRERRFRIRRSPEWTRPKKRGTGYRTENAKASVSELTGGDEVFLSARAAEVGLLVGELVGMAAAQFQQVAMLPQGEFARFLHASSQDRHDVLQQLFRTDRFARIEDWVQDHSRDLRARAEEAHETVHRLLHTIADRAGVPADDDLDLDSVRGVLARAVSTLEALQSARTATEAEEAAARVSADTARRHGETARRRDDATATLARLAETEDAAAATRRRLDDDLRARACAPLLVRLGRAAEDREATDAARGRALAGIATLDLGPALPDLLPVLTQVRGAGRARSTVGVGAVDEAVEEVRHLAGVVRGLLPRVEARRDAHERVRVADAELVTTEATLRELAERRAALPTRLDEARAVLGATTEAAGRAEALDLRLDEARARAAAAARLETLETAATVARDAHRDARDSVADAREHAQDLRDRRLAGIAAELAGALRDGDPCSVCGSPDHPRPATGGAPTVTDAEQADAEHALERAQALLVAATERLTAAEAELATVRGAAGGLDVSAAREQVGLLERELTEATAARERLPEVEARVTALRRDLDEVTEAEHAARRGATALQEKQKAALEVMVSADREIEQALPGTDPEDLDSLPAVLDDVIAVLTRARVALVQHEQAARRVEELAGEAEETLAEHGLPGVEAARTARLDDLERERLEAERSARDEQAVVARGILESAEVLALPAELPDVAEALARLEAAESARREAGRAADLQSERVEAVRSLVARLEQAVAHWQPLHDEHARADAMSRLVRGMGSDNQLQMRLSAYVLATRLDQVLDAANERLSHMRDQRYLLQRTARAARRGSQAGLGLEVLDQWTGDVREPATLSGGETFVVSLALALGLADVVTQEAGGTEIETLFVDEGFGTLDPDTLDDVMDRLDGLRAGGRTVGVVSHVTELRTRIPVQVTVHKTPRGSTIHARGGNTAAEQPATLAG